MAKIVALISSGRYRQEHYEDVAQLLNKHHASPGMCLDFADLFAADNPDFDRAKFLAACGLKS